MDTFTDDIKSYLDGNKNIPGLQNVVGFKQLFQGYIGKDWFGADET